MNPKTPSRWTEKISRSSFFLVAVLLHLLVRFAKEIEDGP
jgi:hypothetical protein